jgi:hypothetical protein
VLLKKLIVFAPLVLNLNVNLFQYNVNQLISIMMRQRRRIGAPIAASVMVREHVLLLAGAKESQDPE